MAAYSEMRTAEHGHDSLHETVEEYAGDHAHLGPLAGLLEGGGLVKSHSMDVVNDPRFFQDNVINYRLAAIGGLSIVSGLLVQNAMDHVFEMNKDMTLNPTHLDGFFQLVSFLLLNMVLFMNMLATYVGVAQPYHTIRLMTAGATGFETAASYYLNKNIVAWRHLSIKGMLLSLPIYLISSGLRLVVKFDREAYYKDPQHLGVPAEARGYGFFFCGFFIFSGIMLFYVHFKHFAIFRERYATLMTPPALAVHMRTMATPSVVTQPNPSWLGGLLDV